MNDMAKQAVSALTLGSDRSSLSLEPISTALTELLENIKAQDADSFLDQIAAITLYNRAGWIPQKITIDQIAPAQPDYTPACSRLFASDLESILTSGNLKLLSEALELLSKHSKRMPEQLLPDVLNFAISHPSQRAAIVSTIGHRGRWLAQQNPLWSFAATEETDFDNNTSPDLDLTMSRWPTMPRARRCAVLEWLRSTNPQDGLAVARSTWKTDSATDRESLLRTLKNNLSLMDEEFLEEARSDRSAPVRKVAIELLASLPDSVFVREATAIARSLIDVRRNLTGQQYLSATLPSEYDPAWRRYGIEEKSWIANVSDGAWYLIQWLGLAPPSTWCKQFKLGRQQLIKMAESCPWSDCLFLGWSQASRRGTDLEWKYDMLNYWVTKRDPRTSLGEFIPKINELGHLAEEFLLEQLQSDGGMLHDGHPSITLLNAYTGMWGEHLSREVVTRIVRTAKLPANRQPQIWATLSLLSELGYRIPPQLEEQFVQAFGSTSDYSPNWTKTVNSFLDTLTVRQHLHKEISV